MGRWAEVYFTSPPEKREQAVLELLRELRAVNPGLEGPILAASPGLEQTAPVLDAVTPDALQTAIACRACGRENPESHRFCGMCGKTLLGEDSSAEGIQSTDLRDSNRDAAEVQMADRRIPDVHAPSAETSGFHVSDLHIEDQHIEDHTPYDRPIDRRFLDEHGGVPERHETSFIPPREAVYEPVLNQSELSLFQTGRKSGYTDGQEDEMFLDPPIRRPYRIYMGAALAVVIFALGYMAWRSTQNESQSARVEPQAPPALTTQPAAAALAAPNSAKTDAPADAPDRTTAPNQQAAAQQSATQAADVPAKAERAASERIGGGERKASAGVEARPTPRALPIAEKTQTESLGGYGADELATAQRYLDGTDGQAPNPAEAAQWLWKAMAKHNTKAPLLLADLYLRGQGVSKNCDQARVLLDSATRAGVKDAAERLRHLQAFGCQ